MTFVVGHEDRISFSVSQTDMETFAALSGDRAPLHEDDAFARTKGFDGRVVYGALMIAKISQMIGMRLPGADGIWAGLKVSFREPLYVDEEATLTAVVKNFSASVGLLVLDLSVTRGETVLLKGMAEVVVKGGETAS